MGKELALAEIRKNKSKIDALLMRADACDQNIYKATKQMVVWGWEAGKYLCEVKDLIPHGMFEQYIDEHPDLHFSARSARSYMQLYKHKDELIEEFGSEVYAKSIESCLKLISKPRPEPDKSPVDGTSTCPRGGEHTYDATGCCTKCCDQLPADISADEEEAQADDDRDGDDQRASTFSETEPGAALSQPEAAEADAAEVRRGRGERAGDGGGPDRRGDLFRRGEQLYGELTRLLDELNILDPYKDKDGIQISLSMSYENFRKWKRK